MQIKPSTSGWPNPKRKEKVAEGYGYNLLRLFIHRVDDAIVPDAYSVKLFRASQLYGLTRKRILP